MSTIEVFPTGWTCEDCGSHYDTYPERGCANGCTGCMIHIINTHDWSPLNGSAVMRLNMPAYDAV